MQEHIENHLKQFNFDIRKTEISRYIDQKTKIDVVSFLAECVLEFVKNDENKEFTVRDILEMKYFIEHVSNWFNKPSPNNSTAKNEYNKFVGQSLSTLYYSGLLYGKKQKSWKYRCRNKELLIFVSQNMRKAQTFLSLYCTKILEDSGLGDHLEKFLTQQNKHTLDFLKDEFYELMIKYTPIGSKCATGVNPGQVECMRIFNPSLNIICASQKKCGTTRGTLSDHVIRADELAYNRINFRDLGRPKELTRQEAAISEVIVGVNYYDREESQAKNTMKSIYKNKPMFLDEYYECPQPEIHHIIPKSHQPKFAGYIENLINLCPTQHYNQAHMVNKKMLTGKINNEYQRKLLIAKSFYIERSLSCGHNHYSKQDFVDLLNDGIKLQISEIDNFSNIRNAIAKEYFDLQVIDKISKMLITVR